MDEEQRLHFAVIAGASKAIRYKEENPGALENDVIKHVTDNIKEIISNIDQDDSF